MLCRVTRYETKNQKQNPYKPGFQFRVYLSSSKNFHQIIEGLTQSEIIDLSN